MASVVPLLSFWHLAQTMIATLGRATNARTRIRVLDVDGWSRETAGDSSLDAWVVVTMKASCVLPLVGWVALGCAVAKVRRRWGTRARGDETLNKLRLWRARTAGPCASSPS